MTTPELSPRGGRETRLLLVTIAISVGVLLLLARFRFPADASIETAQSAPAPLERLAARAAYDELASIMADLERRIAPRVTIVRTQNAVGGVAMAIAPRMLPDRAVVVLGPDDIVMASSEQELINQGLSGRVAVLRVRAVDESAVAIRQLPLRGGPRYVGVLEATGLGPALAPVYVGRVDSFDDPHTGTPLLSFAGLQRDVPAGAAIFSLEGLFVGLVRDSGATLTVVPAEVLRSVAQSTQPSPVIRRGDLGIDVDVLTARLSRATGADRGVVVVHVASGGAADGVLQPGDVIQSIDGIAITNPIQLREVARGRSAGTNVTIAGVRARAPLQVSITAADATKADDAVEGLGVVSRDVSRLGIEIVAVREGSAAARAGLQRGDLIVAVDGEKEPETAALTRRFQSAKPAAVFLLTVQRGPAHHVLSLDKP